MRIGSIFKISSLYVVTLVGLTGCGASKPPPPTAEQLQLQQMMTASNKADAGVTPVIPSFQPRPGRPGDEIAPGNLLHLLCSVDPKITGDYRVNFDGTVLLPYDVKAQAGGLTLSQFKGAVQEQYKAYFKSAPSIVVTVVEKKFYVRAEGLVDKPGEYLVGSNGSLDEVIAQAGGLQKSADSTPSARYARIVDGGYRALLKMSDYYAGSTSAAPVWRGGETVFFQNEGSGIGDLLGMDKKYVQVLGQVRKPGEVPFQNTANFLYYLVQAGGPTDRADMTNLVVVRSDGDKVKTFPFTMDEPAKIPQILGGDIVMVQANNPTNLERNTSLFGNLGGVLSSIAAVLVVGGL